MDEFTLNTYSDVGLLATIFNGQAMLVSDGESLNYYWVAIAVAAIVGLFFGIAKRLLNPNNQAALRHVGVNFIVGILLVIVYTTMTARIIVQSERDGSVAAVDNVPVVSFITPVLMSSLSIDFSRKMETAYQAVNANYTMLGGTTNQTFGEPLRALLSMRTALTRLPRIQSDLRAIVGSCIDNGADLATLNQKISFAGNALAGGGTALESLSIMGTTVPTSVGVLLKAASQNTTAFVTDMTPPDGNTVALSCESAVEIVVGEINAAFSSQMFSTNGARAPANAIDRASSTEYTFDLLGNTYAGLRNFALTTGMTAVGADKANAEMINLIFGQELMRNLDCLKEGGSNKTTCLASAGLANAIEQGNIDAAANGSAFMSGFGAFADALFAVIIGLSPVFIIVMIFLGQNLYKMAYAYLQTMIWSVLVYNFGAVLVNAIIMYRISAGLSSLAGNAIINQAAAVEAYRLLSLQVGAAASLLTSLTLLVPTLFSLSQSATMAGIGRQVVGQDRFNEKAVAPTLVETSPMTRISPIADTSLTPTGGAITKTIGSVAGAEAQMRLMESNQQFQRAQEHQRSLSHRVEDQVTHSKDFFRSVVDGKGTSVGITKRSADLISDAWNKSHAGAKDVSNSSNINLNSSNTNRNSAEAYVGANASVGVSFTGPSASASAETGVRATGSKASDDTFSAGRGSSLAERASASVSESQQVIANLEKSMQQTTDRTHREEIGRAIRDVQSHSVSDSDVQSLVNSSRDTASIGSSIVGQSSTVSDNQIVAASGVPNSALNRVLDDRAAFAALGPEYQQHYDKSHKFIESGNAGTIGGANAEQSKHNIASIRALADYANNPAADPEKRAVAVGLMAKSLSAVIGTTATDPGSLSAVGTSGVKTSSANAPTPGPSKAPAPKARHKPPQGASSHRPSAPSTPKVPDHVNGPSDDELARRRNQVTQGIEEGKGVLEVYKARDRDAENNLSGRAKVVVEHVVGANSQKEDPSRKPKP
jgi:hypothetical protein